ncbi:hypothetical protein WDU94_010723 [Cyamophila willieti]
MECIKTNKTVITQAAEDDFYVTHPTNQTYVRCGQKDVLIQHVQWGAAKVKLPCNCLIITKGVAAVDKLYPCDARLVDDLEVTHSIPQPWTIWANDANKINRKLTSLRGDLHEIINNNWTIHIPDLQIQEETEMPYTIKDAMSEPSILCILLACTTTATFTVIVGVLLLRKCGCNICRKEKSGKITIKMEENRLT